MRRVIGIITLLVVLLTAAVSTSAQAITVIDLPDIPAARLRVATSQPIGLLFADGVITDYALPRPPLALIDLTTGAEITRLDGDFDYVRDALFSADGTVLYTAHENGEIIAWDVPAGTERARLTLPSMVGYRLAEWNGALIAFVTEVGSVTHFMTVDVEAGAITRILRIGQIETGQQFRDMLGEFELRCELQIITVQAGERTLFADAPLYAATASGAILAIQPDGTFSLIEPPGEPCMFSIRRLNTTADGLIAFSTATRDVRSVIALDPTQGVRTLDLALAERLGALTVVPGTNTGYFFESTDTTGTIRQVDFATGELTDTFTDESLNGFPAPQVELYVVGDGDALVFTVPTRNQLFLLDLP